MRTESRELLAVGIFGGKSRVGDRIEILLRRGRTFCANAIPRDAMEPATVKPHNTMV
jgi:hypothetical protein